MAAYTVEYREPKKILDRRGEWTDGYYRIRLLEIKYKYILPAMSGYPTSKKEELLEEYLDRIKKHPELQGATYIPWGEAINQGFRSP